MRSKDFHQLFPWLVVQALKVTIRFEMSRFLIAHRIQLHSCFEFWMHTMDLSRCCLVHGSVIPTDLLQEFHFNHLISSLLCSLKERSQLYLKVDSKLFQLVTCYLTKSKFRPLLHWLAILADLVRLRYLQWLKFQNHRVHYGLGFWLQ